MCFCRISKTVTRQLAKKRVRVREPERPLVYIFKIDIIFFSSEIAHLFISDILYWP